MQKEGVSRFVGQVNIADKAGVWYNAVLRGASVPSRFSLFFFNQASALPTFLLSIFVALAGDMNPISVGYSSHIKDGSVVTVDSSLAAGYDSSTVIGNFVTIGEPASFYFLLSASGKVVAV